MIKLNVPRFLVEDVVDVSVGKDQICAISSFTAIVCWNYTNEGYKLMYVPDPLYKKGSAKHISTSYNKHCGVDSNNTLTCWGKHQFNTNRSNDRKYDQKFSDDRVDTVSVG